MFFGMTSGFIQMLRFRFFGDFFCINPMWMQYSGKLAVTTFFQRGPSLFLNDSKGHLFTFLIDAEVSSDQIPTAMYPKLYSRATKVGNYNLH